MAPSDGRFIFVCQLESEPRDRNLFGVKDDHLGHGDPPFVFLSLFLGAALPAVTRNLGSRVGQAADRSCAVFLVERMSSSVQIVQILQVVSSRVCVGCLQESDADADVPQIIFVFAFPFFFTIHLIALDPQPPEGVQLLRVIVLLILRDDGACGRKRPEQHRGRRVTKIDQG